MSQMLQQTNSFVTHQDIDNQRGDLAPKSHESENEILQGNQQSNTCNKDDSDIYSRAWETFDEDQLKELEEELLVLKSRARLAQNDRNCRRPPTTSRRIIEDYEEQWREELGCFYECNNVYEDVEAVSSPKKDIRDDSPGEGSVCPSESGYTEFTDNDDGKDVSEVPVNIYEELQEVVRESDGRIHGNELQQTQSTEGPDISDSKYKLLKQLARRRATGSSAKKNLPDMQSLKSLCKLLKSRKFCKLTNTSTKELEL